MHVVTRLGDLERATMQAVWLMSGPVTARQVAEALADRALAYTTVLTVLTRLEKKGLLARDNARGRRSDQYGIAWRIRYEHRLYLYGAA